MLYRKVNKSEYRIISEIHLAAFDGFFLTSLGKRFLNTYYKSCLKSNESIAVCAVDNEDKITGFSFGSLLSKGFHKRIVKQNILLFLSRGMIILLTRPAALLRLANNLDKNANKADDGNYAELLSIAVLPSAKGTGIGKELIKNFEIEAIRKGCKKIALTTDYYNNDDVLEFYKRSGYKVFYEFTAYPDRKMYKLIKDITE